MILKEIKVGKCAPESRVRGIKKLFADLKAKMQKKGLSMKTMAKINKQKEDVVCRTFLNPEKCTLPLFLDILSVVGTGTMYFDNDQYTEEKEKLEV